MDLLILCITASKQELSARLGQIHIHKEGFFEYGAGRATDFDIADYQSIIDKIKRDSVLGGLIEVVTPTLALGGIAGNFNENSSQTFLGVGLIPSDQDKLRRWNAYGVSSPPERFPLTDSDEGGFVGTGLAKVLSLCDELRIVGCTDMSLNPDAYSDEVDESILALQEDSLLPNESTANDAPAAIELLGSSASGAPNVIRLPILSAQTQAQKAVDDRLVAMPLHRAQQLIYGSDEGRVNQHNHSAKAYCRYAFRCQSINCI